LFLSYKHQATDHNLPSKPPSEKLNSDTQSIPPHKLDSDAHSKPPHKLDFEQQWSNNTQRSSLCLHTKQCSSNTFADSRSSSCHTKTRFRL